MANYLQYNENVIIFVKFSFNQTLFMKKILLFLLYVLTTSIVGNAEVTGYRSIVFHRTDGTTLSITIEDLMSYNVSNDDVTLECYKGTISVSISDVKYWLYSKNQGDDTLWLDIHENTDDTVDIIVADNTISLYNLPENSNVRLVSMDGRVIILDKASKTYKISLCELAQGVYVLTYNEKSLKIVVK